MTQTSLKQVDMNHLPRIHPLQIERSHLFTHANCMDGAAAAAIFRCFGGLHSNIHFCKPNDVTSALIKADVLDQTGPKDFLIFADVRVADWMALELEKRGNVVLLDHHRSSASLSDYTWCCIDEGICGSGLLHQYFTTHCDTMCSGPYIERLEHIVAAVDDYDRGIHKNPGGDELSLLMNALGTGSFIFELLHKDHTLAALLYKHKFIVLSAKHKREAHVLETLKRPIRTIVAGKQAFAYFSSNENNAVLAGALALHPAMWSTIAPPSASTGAAVATPRRRAGLCGKKTSSV
jgi:hypothetical protein